MKPTTAGSAAPGRAKELLEVLRPRYLKANKAKKQKMLGDFTAATVYHRKYVICVLKTKFKSALIKRKKHGRFTWKNSPCLL
jgi:hypothetical protein